jgi:hypothetical protein
VKLSINKQKQKTKNYGLKRQSVPNLSKPTEFFDAKLLKTLGSLSLWAPKKKGV